MCQRHVVKLSKWVAGEVQNQKQQEIGNQQIGPKLVAIPKEELKKYSLKHQVQLELSSPCRSLLVMVSSPSLDATGIARVMPENASVTVVKTCKPILLKCHMKVGLVS